MNDFIIYGAGKKGKCYLQFLEKYGIDKQVRAFCDRKASVISHIEDKEVVTYEEARSMQIPFLIGVGSQYANEIQDILEKDGVSYYNNLSNLLVDKLHVVNRTDFEHDYCAFFHVDAMDDYFDDAESERSLDVFWGGESAFLPLFRQLNLSNVIELACGRGRHVYKYLDAAGQIMLVDILKKNIDCCKERFMKEDKISYYINNGSDLAELRDKSYTALFTYDAMVHFELLDVAKYIQETYRVLINGGMALFHHSNNHSDYKASFETSVGGRSYMSKEIFAYLAYRTGFEIVEQKVIDWGVPDIDCLTLVRKPA